MAWCATLVVGLRLAAQGIPPFSPDWLVTPFTPEVRVELSADGKDLTMENGLIRRVWRLPPNAACWSYETLIPAAQLVRADCPEARLQIGGRCWPVGGLEGAPEYGYLEAEWLETMSAPKNAFMFAGYTVGEPQAPYPWTPKFGAPAVP